MKKTFKISIVDYKVSNLKSVSNALNFLEINNEITSNPKKILSSDAAILPGVGSFSQGMKNLNGLSLIDPIKEFIFKNKPFLGICLGMQLLFDQSHEFCITPGLGIFKGEVKSFKTINKTCKIPHLGWNNIEMNPSISKNKLLLSPFKNMEKNQNLFYFVHSFIVLPNNSKDILTETNYENVKFCSSILNKNVFASQFHPEKSGNFGLKVLKNFFSKFQ
jgi:glutamine amidotransferase|tara:strand:+ start:1398 stop:2054 length:657 start_codon:yes stop_codon:yes gene_type:complete